MEFFDVPPAQFYQRDKHNASMLLRDISYNNYLIFIKKQCALYIINVSNSFLFVSCKRKKYGCSH